MRRARGAGRVRRIAVLVSLVALGTGAPREAVASPVFETVGGVGGQGGLNGRTFPGGASSAFDNPALLVESESGLTLG
ncbi:MAG: hypothetical protein ACRENE_32705, partial [Polyangiaceae bacterium]